MSSRMLAYAAAAAVAAPLLASPAFSAGGDSAPSTPNCTRGTVWDQSSGRCVEQSSKLDTDSLYHAGRGLAQAGRYGEAISVLSLAADRDDPRVLNYLGFSHRMQGRVIVGLGYYEEALRIDPDNVLVREYLGEAYLQMGDLAAAEGQLDEIARRCGQACAEYAQLEAHISAWRAGERAL